MAVDWNHQIITDILKLISLYQQFYYAQDFLNLTHNIIIPRLFVSRRFLSINLKAAKPHPKAAEHVTISRHALGLEAHLPTMTWKVKVHLHTCKTIWYWCALNYLQI